jgi:DNA-binding NarL/FixJ family response regulator
MPDVLIGGVGAITKLGLRDVLGQRGFAVVIEEGGPSRIVSRIVAVKPSVVVLDLDAAGGLDFAERIAAAFPATKVIACSSEEPRMRVFPPFQRGRSYASRLTPERLVGAVASDP